MTTTENNLPRLISEMDKAQSSEELLKLLEKISSLGSEENSRYSQSGDHSRTAEACRYVAEAYYKAVQLIDRAARFHDIRNMSDSLREAARYWERRVEASLHEVARMYKEEGRALQEKRLFKESIDSFGKAVHLEPNDSYTWNDIGNSYFQLKNYKKAKRNYEQSLAVNPSNTFALSNMGLVLGRLGQYEQAIGYCEKAVKIDPRSASAWNMMGYMYADKFCDHNRAREYFEKALAIQPDYVLAKANLAETLLILKEYTRSEKLASEVKDHPYEQTYGFVSRFIIACSLYYRNAADKGIEALQDLWSYYMTIPSDYKFHWRFLSLKKMMNEGNLPLDVKQLLLLVISLPEAETDIEKLKILEQINNTILTMATAKGRLERIQSTESELIPGRKLEDIDIKIRNTSNPDPWNPGWYYWEIFLDVPEQILSQIKNVTYTLHPTFRNPVITIDRPDGGFRLKSRGWGEFRVKVEIRPKDGPTMTKYHWLKLAGPTPLDRET